MRGFQKYLHIFMVAAFMLSSVSPACAFISGASWGDICGADGSVKKVEIPAELLAYLPQDEQEQPTMLESQMDCGFCFMGQNLNAVLPVSSDFTLLPYSGYVSRGSGSYAPLGQSLKPFDSQGPPSIFV